MLGMKLWLGMLVYVHGRDLYLAHLVDCSHERSLRKHPLGSKCGGGFEDEDFLMKHGDFLLQHDGLRSKLTLCRHRQQLLALAVAVDDDRRGADGLRLFTRSNRSDECLDLKLRRGLRRCTYVQDLLEEVAVAAPDHQDLPRAAGPRRRVACDLRRVPRIPVGGR